MQEVWYAKIPRTSPIKTHLQTINSSVADFRGTKKMCDVCTSRFHQVSCRDFCCVSGNKRIPVLPNPIMLFPSLRAPSGGQTYVRPPMPIQCLLCEIHASMRSLIIYVKTHGPMSQGPSVFTCMAELQISGIDPQLQVVDDG